MHYLFKKPSFIFGITVVVVIVFSGIFGPMFAADPREIIRNEDGGVATNTPPGKYAPLGTDQSGQDFLSNLLWGIRNSLIVGILAGLITIIISTIVGGIGAYKGGLMDEFGMLVTNIILVFPVLPALLVISAYIEGRTLTLIIAIIGMISWPWDAQAIRSQILSLKERDFVHLARVSGIGDVKIAIFEVLPHVLSYLVLVLTISIGASILTEAGISMIGLGPENTITLGVLLQHAIERDVTLRRGYWWLFVVPGLILTFLMFAMYLVQSNLDAVFNPRLREE